MTPTPEYPLGGFAWLDKNARLRRWFAKWLAGVWEHIYRESLHQLQTKADWDTYESMEKAVKRLALKLPRLSTAKQLETIDAKARRLGFNTTRERVEDELRSFLTSAGQHKQHAEAFKASPWCNHFATMEHLLEQAGRDIPYKSYPGDPNAQLALATVITELGSLEILRGGSPAMSRLFAVRRGFDQFDKAIKSLPAESPLLSAFRKIEPGLRDYSAALQAEINLRAKEPAAFFTPLRVRRLQRRVYFAVRRLCRPKDGPDKLASFIQGVLRAWPRVYSGMEFNLEDYFNTDTRLKLVRDHLHLAPGQMNKEGRALWRVLQAVVFRDELRGSLLHLANKADQQAKQRRKGWPHLRKALRVVFNHIGRELSDEEVFRNFERANFAGMRNLTRERRMQLLPELGSDPDPAVRDLTKAERMIVAERFLKKITKTPLKRDADGKNSASTRYGRAMKAVKKQLGQG